METETADRDFNFYFPLVVFTRGLISGVAKQPEFEKELSRIVTYALEKRKRDGRESKSPVFILIINKVSMANGELDIAVATYRPLTGKFELQYMSALELIQ